MDRNTEVKIDCILKKYTVNAPERTVRKEARAVVSEVVGVDIPLEEVSYQKGRLRVDASPLVRSQIHMKKEAIKTVLEKKLKNRQISDIQ